jgi:hypothetical protein
MGVDDNLVRLEGSFESLASTNSTTRARKEL